MSKIRVAVLAGGPSPEREVSLRSGQMVLKNLDPSRYAPFLLDYSELLADPALAAGLPGRADFVFLALHGRMGEDGVAQGLLDALGLPYNGSGVMASGLAMNKIRTKAIYKELGLPQPKGLDFQVRPDGGFRAGLAGPWKSPLLDREAIASAVAGSLGWDVVVKGASQGSTIGIAMADSPASFWAGVHEVAAWDLEILVEERIPGLEVTAGVLGGDAPEALPLVEIRPKASAFFDYEAKYTPGASEEICPARLDPALTAAIQALALRAHAGLGCWGYSRSDFMIKDGQAYILETNTLPGLTETSLFPQACRAAGVMLPELLDRLITDGLARPGRRAAASAPVRG